MNELDRLLGRIEDWTEELLLRGTAQFEGEDARQLERLAGEAGRLGMDLLEQLLLGVARAGERARLAGSASGEEGEWAELTGHFFRLCAYAELARDQAGEAPGSGEPEPEFEETEENE